MHPLHRDLRDIPTFIESKTGYKESEHTLTFLCRSDNWTTTSVQIQISAHGGLGGWTANWQDVAGATFNSTDNAPKNVILGKGVWYRAQITAVDSDADLDIYVSS